jgi:hypothetical protein
MHDELAVDHRYQIGESAAGIDAGDYRGTRASLRNL